MTTEIEDGCHVEDDARHARELGFGGKLCIHPRQVQPILAAWKPTAAELQWASRIVATEGAVAVDGAMVDEPIRVRARAILARSAALA